MRSIYVAVWLAIASPLVKAEPILLSNQESYLFVAATLNGHPVRLLLDTGAGVNIISPETTQRLQLSATDVKTSISGMAGHTQTVSGVAFDLEVGGLHDPAATGVIMPLPSELGVDGIVGTTFLSRYQVVIDSARRRLELLPALTPAPADAVALKMVNGVPCIRASVAGQEGWFEVDTGSGDALVIFPGFGEQAGVARQFPSAPEGITGEGVDGVLREKLVRFSEARLGRFALGNVTASLSVRPHAPYSVDQEAGLLGSQVWERFVVTLDYAHGCVSLQPNQHLTEPFVGNRSGLGLKFPNGNARVVSVLAGSPAAEAGIVAGDALLTLDGTSLEQLDLWEVRRRLRDEPGTELQLTLRRASGEVYSTSLRLLELQ